MKNLWNNLLETQWQKSSVWEEERCNLDYECWATWVYINEEIILKTEKRTWAIVWWSPDYIKSAKLDN